jgi:amidase
MIAYETSNAASLADALARGDVSAAELVEQAVRTVEAKDGPINAVVVRDFDRALQAARAADAALARGERRPLLGVPMTVKESHDVAGLPTTWGLEQFKDWRPPGDSTGVARLKAAGAIILGKTNVPTMLGDYQAANPIYGRTNNPHDLARSPGGSSGGGAAALAAGMVPLELGSDFGGSIRVPAHFCGVYGHKPSYGLIPTTGHTPPPFNRARAAIQFEVIGPMARSATDLALALGVLAGPEGDEALAYRVALPPPRITSLAAARVLVLTHHPLCATDAEVVGPIDALAERLAGLGAKVSRESAHLPDLDAGHPVYVAMMGSMPRAPKPMDAPGWMAGLDAIVRHRQTWARLFSDFDVVLTPPLGIAAFPHDTETALAERRVTINGEATAIAAQIAWPGVAGFPGLPATCAPFAKTALGLPVGVQIIGPRFEDLTPIAFAGLLAEELGDLGSQRRRPATASQARP